MRQLLALVLVPVPVLALMALALALILAFLIHFRSVTKMLEQL